MDKGSFSAVVDFIREILTGFTSSVLFFGGPLDIVRYIADILLITFVLYSVLRLLRETRAWQLLKGVILIVVFTFACSLLGLQMVGFLFNKVLYIVALASVIIFQPELRRALETVGLKSFSSLTGAFTSEYPDSFHKKMQSVDALVLACEKMAKEYTGALIIIERKSKLGELIEQENAVKLDSDVSESMLQSIFFKGSPLHDGAILIRISRIVAARCHIPLADNYHVSENLGTRHRAAIGASELGDAVAVVVSEERGSISVALSGCLYPMESAEDLRNNLFDLLDISGTHGKFVSKMKLHRRKPSASSVHVELSASDMVMSADEDQPDEMGEPRLAVPAACEVPRSIKKEMSKQQGSIFSKKAVRYSRFGQAMMLLISFLASVCLWMYIQISTNPISTKTMTILVQVENEDVLTNQGLADYSPVVYVDVDIVGRKNTLEDLSEEDLSATIDYSEIAKPGVVELPVEISSDQSVYFRVKSQDPETVTVNIYEILSDT